MSQKTRNGRTPRAADENTVRNGSEKPAARMGAEMPPGAKAADLLQLRRAKGQVDGIERMIEEGRYCADIIVQITAARASLQVVAKNLLARHLKACHEAALGNGGAAADEMYQELVDLVSKMSR